VEPGVEHEFYGVRNVAVISDYLTGVFQLNPALDNCLADELVDRPVIVRLGAWTIGQGYTSRYGPVTPVF